MRSRNLTRTETTTETHRSAPRDDQLFKYRFGCGLKGNAHHRMTETTRIDVKQQAEDALSQGMEKLHHILVEAVVEPIGVYLDLSENQLSGEIFQSLNESLNLKHLNLAHNRFTRHKFPQIEMLPGLEYLNLSKTNLVGHIPYEISKLINLNALDLSMNHLDGKIPLLRNKHLQILDLSYNNLSGAVPQSVLKKLPWMQKYNFSYNNLTLCASDIKPDILQTAFFGSVNSCSLAADPHLFRRKDTGHKGMKLALVHIRKKLSKDEKLAMVRAGTEERGTYHARIAIKPRKVS
ncbi:Leucine-rich repeat [Sesbania bispinosa]|nr:Leucine-rich repeat [Sesbania bispinosa]